MSKKVVTLAINNIKEMLAFLKTTDEKIYEKTFRALKFHKPVYKRCYSYGLYRLSDIERSLDNLREIYNNDGDKLISLSKNIRTVYKKCCEGKNLSKKAAKEFTKKQKTITPKKAIVHDKLIKRINKKTHECCLCATLKELSKISEEDFIKIMKSNYRPLTGYKLEAAKLRSWRDEYHQFINTIIPIFNEHNKNILKFNILFELKLPQDLKNLDSNKFVFADAVIVGNDGIIVFEFKQLDSTSIEFDVKQAAKYMHRLRYHKTGAHQRKRYTYVVYTKEVDNQVHTFKKKRDFWFGSPKAVAIDLCSKYFDHDVSCLDIKKWLDAGFWKKRH